PHRRPDGQGDRSHSESGPDGAHRRRQDLHFQYRGCHPHPHRRTWRRRHLTAASLLPRHTQTSRHDRVRQETQGDLHMADAKSVLKSIKDKDVKFVDLRFTDPRGKMQHVTMDVAVVDEDMFAEGVMFDGSSIAGWKAINESDMTLMPDPETATI